ncbi:MAG TPA: BON domain-containing protein [Pyrinomonadaceae bacterium]|nr:BON domain-containing protein [Pyrinomonadaceae bacterium]
MQERKKPDYEIKQQVLRELKWDSRIAWAQIGADVHDGIVTLTGTVRSYAAKSAAQQAAHRVAGVLDVANDIEVRPSGTFARTDAEIAKAVRHTLEWDALVPDERIKSTVSGGWVTLEGNVDLWREREDAERSVLKLAGVVGVINQITIIPRQVDPEELRDEIEDALERRAEREADRLRIEVKDGAVELWGRVHSWQEKRAVLGSIGHMPGVMALKEHLRIDPYF